MRLLETKTLRYYKQNIFLTWFLNIITKPGKYFLSKRKRFCTVNCYLSEKSCFSIVDSYLYQNDSLFHQWAPWKVYWTFESNIFQMSINNECSFWHIYQYIVSRFHNADLPKSFLFVTFINTGTLWDVIIFCGYMLSLKKNLIGKGIRK